MTGPSTSGRTAVAGIDIGGTTTRVALTSPQLEMLACDERPTPARHGGAEMVATAARLVEDLVAATGVQLIGAGVGAAGVIDSEQGRVRVASDSFRGWSGFDVIGALTDRIGVPACIENDVNAFLHGEVAAGTTGGDRHALGMMLGTGVGGALWLDGRLFDGPHGAAGEIGHIPGFGDLPCTCGGRGHLETLASGRLLGIRYRERTGKTLTAREIAERAAADDRDAIAVFTDAGTALARAILITAGLVDVTTVVIGGGLTGAWPVLAPAIRQALAAEPPVSGSGIRLAKSRLGTDAVAIGAAALIRDRLATASEGGDRVSHDYDRSGIDGGCGHRST